MTATFIGSRLSGQSLRNYISPVSTFYAFSPKRMSCYFVRFLGQLPPNYIVVFYVHTLECLPSFFLAQIFSIKLGPYCIWFSAEDNMIDRLCGIARYCNTSAGVIPLCSFLLPTHNYLIDSDANADMNFQG